MPVHGGENIVIAITTSINFSDRKILCLKHKTSLEKQIQKNFCSIDKSFSKYLFSKEKIIRFEIFELTVRYILKIKIQNLNIPEKINIRGFFLHSSRLTPVLRWLLIVLQSHAR